MGRARFCKYSDLVSITASPAPTAAVQTGTEDATYPAANLIDGVVAKPAQLTGTSGAWTIAFGAATRVDAIVIPIHNLDPALAVSFQGHTANSWGAPTLSQALTIPAKREDDFPPSFFRDITATTGYTAAGLQYWRLNVSGVNSAAVKVGELLLCRQMVTFNPNVDWGVREPEQRPIIENRTDYGVSNIYDLGVTLRRFEGSMDTTDAGLAALRSLWRDARGRARSWVLQPDEDVPEAWLVRFATDMIDPTRVMVDRNTIPFIVEEVSRGLYL